MTGASKMSRMGVWLADGGAGEVRTLACAAWDVWSARGARPARDT
jgi:hypothetical protein